MLEEKNWLTLQYGTSFIFNLRNLYIMEDWEFQQNTPLPPAVKQFGKGIKKH